MNVQLTAKSIPNPLPQAEAMRGGDIGIDPSAGTPAAARDFASVLGMKATLSAAAAIHGGPAKTLQDIPVAETGPLQANDPDPSAPTPVAAIPQAISAHGTATPAASQAKPGKTVEDAPAAPVVAMFAPTAPALTPVAGETTHTASVAGVIPPTPVPAAARPKSVVDNSASPTQPASVPQTLSSARTAPPASTEVATATINAATHAAGSAQTPQEKPLAPDAPSSPFPAHLLQSAAATPPTTVAAPATLDIATPLGNAGWDRQLAQQVVWVSNQQHQVADIRINPPQLGPIELRVSLDNQQSGQQATVHFSSPHPEVRDAIEQALPQLREAMAGAGISLGNASVGSESFRGQQAPGQSGAQSSYSSGATPQLAGALDPPPRSTSRGSGLVDIFA